MPATPQPGTHPPAGVPTRVGAGLVPAVASTRFVAAAKALGATASDDVIATAATELITDWDSSGRGYHNLAHLAEMLHLLDHLGSTDPAVELAAWFHDAEYSGLPGQDEAASAARATRALTELGVDPQASHRVAELVLITIDHAPPDGDHPAALLCDADLAILASTAARYAEYAAGVRTDYAHVDDAAFSAGRAAVLRRLLRRATTDPGPDGPLFRTPVAQAWTPRAVENLTAELRRLSDGAT